MEAVVTTLLIAFPLAGAVIRRWSALALQLIGWPLVYLGLHHGWWGNGLGDLWQYVAAAFLVVGVVTTALHVGLARRVKPRRNSAHVDFA